MNTPTEAQLKSILDMVEHVSDRGREGLTAWAHAFIAAHQQVPGGLTIEVGTRVGGSAALFGGLIELMYPIGKWPPLWTVDPYGSKPYIGGDVGQRPAPIYDMEMYLTMKRNLANCPFHVHWMLTSEQFFNRSFSYWWPGEQTMTAKRIDGQLVQMPIGEERIAGGDSATFILLDGEHSARAIDRDFGDALVWAKSGGRIVIDNIDTDPETRGMLQEYARDNPRMKFDFSPQWLIVHV